MIFCFCFCVYVGLELREIREIKVEDDSSELHQCAFGQERLGSMSRWPNGWPI